MKNVCKNVLFSYLPEIFFHRYSLRILSVKVADKNFSEATKTPLSDILKCFNDLTEYGNIEPATPLNTRLFHWHFTSFEHPSKREYKICNFTTLESRISKYNYFKIN